MIEPGALAVLGLMLALMLGSSALGWRLARIAPETLTRTAARTRTFALALCVTNATSTSSAFMDLATKTWGAAASTGLGLAVRSATFWVAVGLNIVFLVCMRLGTIYGCGARAPRRLLRRAALRRAVRAGATTACRARVDTRAPTAARRARLSTHPTPFVLVCALCRAASRASAIVTHLPAPLSPPLARLLVRGAAWHRTLALRCMICIV
jgi:hypothetical protein